MVMGFVGTFEPSLFVEAVHDKKKFVQTLDQNINYILICIKQLIFWSEVCELLINRVLKRKVDVLGLPYLFEDED